MYTRFARHQITDPAALPFSPVGYSRFKYGDGKIAQKYGHELGIAFIEAHGDLLRQHESIVLVPSPYDAIPTASYAMTMAFRERVNRFLYQSGRKSLLQSKIHRYRTYAEDYGAMNLEQRLALISSDTYHLDGVFLRDRLVLFIDDIRITGSHELVIRRQLERQRLNGHFAFLYYAVLDNESIAPDFENYLNYYDVDNMEKVIAIFNDDDFLMNTRIVKYILRCTEETVRGFLERANVPRTHELIDNAIGNSYHLMDEYKTALNLIIQLTDHGDQSSKRTTRSAQRA
jgi:hypothetical protein